MLKQIRTSKVTRITAFYLGLTLAVEIVQPTRLYALTEGPSQPEFNSFSPIGTSDMVDLASGDLNYNIPIMDVGGYPINLSYQSGVTMDQEASWVGLGWNLNVGQINRDVRGLPDDFKGDLMLTSNNMKDNVTVGATAYLNAQLIGALDNLSLGAGLDVQHNNYTGMSAVPSLGASFKISENVSVGMQLSSSTKDGVSVMPNVSLHSKQKQTTALATKFAGGLSASVNYNSRQGLQALNLSCTNRYLNRSGSATCNYSNTTFTPTKRLAFKNNNVRFSFSTGADVYSVHGEISTAGYASLQKLLVKDQVQPAFGYENTEFVGMYGLADFNRENESNVVSKNTMSLPVTNYTYDNYTIQGQNVSGTFRPYRSMVGMVFDPRVDDMSNSTSAGFEMEFGSGSHMGGNARTTTTRTHTGNWYTVSSPYFIDKPAANNPNHERFYYKNVGEAAADGETKRLLDQMGNRKPITLAIINKHADNAYKTKEVFPAEPLFSVLSDPQYFTTRFVRQKREMRNQAIQKVTKGEVGRRRLEKFFKTTGIANTDHHTAGYIVTDENGGQHIYGETTYNKKKREVSFAVGDNTVDHTHGLVAYDDQEATSANNKGRDAYFNAVETPAYAHTYLLTSELSTDYEDLTGNGPTDDDLGSYTKFVYQNKGDYQWRIPYGKMAKGVASYNEGLRTDALDQKGSYLYGVKENKYLQRIETKTHVAFFDLADRKDGYGVNSERGGGTVSTASRMQRLVSIRLYAKPEITVNGQVVDPGPLGAVKPVKMAHFNYEYDLCPGVENTFPAAPSNGKLTLTSVYFTYKGSNMGRYTPYKFSYGAESAEHNPAYHVKAYDIWGNYKPYPTDWITHTTPQEFPYVDQASEHLDDYASSWSLREIELPSGGKIKIDYESDDYKFVQDKKAMEMFKVDGVSFKNDPGLTPYSENNPQELYAGNAFAKWVVIALPQTELGSEISEADIIKRYTEGLGNKPVYYSFLANMTDSSYDFITGYFIMNGQAKVARSGSLGYLYIPMKPIDREGKPNGTNLANPIAVSGCFFGQQNLNAQVNGLADPQGGFTENVIELGRSLVKSIGSMSEIYKGGNGRLMSKRNVSKHFLKEKSWIRLLSPHGKKKGGGARVKSVEMYDEWDKMLNVSPTDPDLARYAKHYGQSYNYAFEDGTSTGVATFEPNISKENPHVLPFYNKPEKLGALTYQELPFGASFFPRATVTYSRVTVSNTTTDAAYQSRTGKVVTEHFTSFDFPTRTDFTNLYLNQVFETNENEVVKNMLKGLLGLKINVKSDLTMGQGFTIETNDMNGKLKKQEVYNNANNLISSTEYKYSVDAQDTRVLNNRVPTISKDGKVRTDQELGTTFDVVNDYNESYSNTQSYGKAVNTDIIPIAIFPIIVAMLIPERSEHTQILHTATTTKVIHRNGILKEKIVTDLGSRVYTKNHAWDAQTGQVLLTETINEFDDKYFTLNFPAYWHYEGMDMAARNMDFSGKFNVVPENESGLKFFKIDGLQDLAPYLMPGDEILIDRSTSDKRLWVYQLNTDKDGVCLMRRNGQKVTSLASLTNKTDFRVIRSGYRNNQMASMANVVVMRNPMVVNTAGNGSLRTDLLDIQTYSAAMDARVINAGAVEYSDTWFSQCENGLPQPQQVGINEYLYNIRGDWRPSKSYAYLSGRIAQTNGATRKSGFFREFHPFYSLDTVNKTWFKTPAKWQSASEVTLFSPYGPELENKDALNRYSSAQYGYRYKMPVAVASNSRYRQMGFDGFEDYELNNWYAPSTVKPHFGFNEQIGQAKHISNKKAHTGRRSLKVLPKESIWIESSVGDCQPQQPQQGQQGQ